MSLFRHPHLLRGIVHTAQGAFELHRGVADLPDDVGESLGWLRMHDEDGEPSNWRHASWPGGAGAQDPPSER